MPVVVVECPHCRRPYSVVESLVGRKARCKGCGRSFALSPSAEAAGTQPGAGVPSTLTSEPAPPADAPEFPLPEKIGRFAVTRRLGAGAFGAVYHATDPLLGRDVAIKVPQPELLQSPNVAERFLREARAVAQLRHPHIVALFEAGLDHGEYYLATEFIDGAPLSEAVHEGAIDPRGAAGVAAALADALQFAHDSGIVHRDVKPANVMLDRQGRPHLMDFGLARLEGAAGAKLTQDGDILGTPAYMAPEQAAAGGSAGTAASDQYGLGATLYELLTGRAPFSGPPAVVLFNVAHRDPPPPRSLAPQVPAGLEAICMKAMARAPGDRYASCGELAEDLRRWLRDEPVRARGPAAPARLARWLRQHRPAAGLPAGIVVGLVAVASVVVAVRSHMGAGTSKKPGGPVTADRPASEPGGLHGPALAVTSDRGEPGGATTPPRTSDPGPGILDATAESRKGERRPAQAGAQTPGEPLSPEARDETRPAEIARAGPTSPRAVAKTTDKPKESAADIAVKAESRPPPDALPLYVQALREAYRACEERRRDQVDRWLDACPDALRGWEWSYLKRLRRSHPTVLEGHIGEVNWVAVSPDGKRIASGGADRKVRVWDERGEGKVLGTHTEPVTRVAIAGDRVISVGRDRIMKEWDVSSTSTEPVRSVSINLDGLSVTDISEDARWIAGGATTGMIKVWERASALEDAGAERDGTLSIEGLAFTPDGKKLLARTSDGWGILHRGAEVLRPRGRRRRGGDALPRDVRLAMSEVRFEPIPKKSDTGKTPGQGDLENVAASRDGRHIAATAGNVVWLYDLETGDFVRKSQWHPKKVTALAFSRDGQWLAADGDDRTVYIWEAATGRWRTSLRGHEDGLTCLRFGMGDASLAASCRDGKVYVWPVGDGVAEWTAVLAPAGPGLEVERRESVFSADSKTLRVKEEGSGRTSSLSSWNPEAPRPPGRSDGILGASPDLGRIVVFDSGRIAIRDADRPTPPRQLGIDPAHFRAGGVKESVRVSAVPMDEDRYAVLIQRNRGDGDVRDSIGVWDETRREWAWSERPAASASMLGGVALRASVPAAPGAENCDALIYRRGESAIAVRSAANGAEILAEPGTSYQVYPRGGLVAIFSDDPSGKAAIWSLEPEPKKVVELAGRRVAFDPSGKRVASWGGPRAGLSIWDLAAPARPRELAPLEGDAAFSPDGGRIAAHRGRSLVILDAATGRELLELPEAPGTPVFSPDGLKLACVGERLTIRYADPSGSGPR